MLEIELNTYYKNKNTFNEKSPSGGYVVIKGDDVLGIWETRLDALKAGIEKYGNVEFLVKDIDESDTILNFSRNIFVS